MTPEEVSGWDLSTLDEMGDSASDMSDANEDLGDDLIRGRNRTSDWEGESGDAFRAVLASTHSDILDTADRNRALSSAIRSAQGPIGAVRSEVNDIMDTAASYGWTVKSDWTLDTSASEGDDEDEDDEDSKEEARAELQSRLDRVKVEAHQADQDLADGVRGAVPTDAPNSGHGHDEQPHPGQKDTPDQDKKDSTDPGQPHTSMPPATPSKEPAEHQPEINTHIGNVGDGIEKSAGKASEYAAIPKQSTGLGPTQGQLNRAAKQLSGDLETVSKFGKKLSSLGYIMEGFNGLKEGREEMKQGKSLAEAAEDVGPKVGLNIGGSLAGATLGAETGAGIGAAIGTVVPGVGTVVGAAVGGGIGGLAGGFAGSEVGESMGKTITKGLHAIFDDH